MQQRGIASLLLAMASLPAVAGVGLPVQTFAPKFWQYHQVPDKDGIYYVAPRSASQSW